METGVKGEAGTRWQIAAIGVPRNRLRLYELNTGLGRVPPDADWRRLVQRIEKRWEPAAKVGFHAVEEGGGKGQMKFEIKKFGN